MIDKKHPCYGCACNEDDRICVNIIEFDAQCEDCESSTICLSLNPKKEEE